MAFAVRFPPPKGEVLILMLLSIHKDIFKIIIFQFYPYKKSHNCKYQTSSAEEDLVERPLFDLLSGADFPGKASS